MIRYVLGVVLLFVDLAAILGLACIVRQRLREPDDPLGGALATALVFFAWITVSLTGLGLAGLLCPLAILGLHISMFIVARYVLHRQAVPREAQVERVQAGSCSQTEPIDEADHAADLGAEGLTALAYYAPRITALLVAGAAVYSIVVGFPSWDTLVYHLPLPIQWLQTGDIGPYLALPFYQRTCTYFPANGELIIFEAICFVGSDVLAPTFNLALLVLTAVALVALQRRMSVRPQIAVPVACLFALTPGLILSHLGSCYVDLYAAFLMLAATYFLLDLCTWSDVFFLGLATGLAVGVKYNCVAFAALIAMPALAAAALGATVHRRQGKILGSSGASTLTCSETAGLWSRPIVRWSRLRRVLTTAAILAGLVTLLAGYWYARNWMRTGNPLYPWTATVAGRAHLAGFDEYGPISLASKLASGQATWSSTIAPGLLGALGISVLALVPCAVLAIVVAMRSRRPSPGAALELYVLTLPVVLGALYIVTPSSGFAIIETWRYNLWGTALAYVCLGVVVDGIPCLARLFPALWLLAMLSDAQDLHVRLAVAHKWRLLGALMAIGIERLVVRARLDSTAATRYAGKAMALATLSVLFLGAYATAYRERLGSIDETRLGGYSGGYAVPALRWFGAHPDVRCIAFAGLARLAPFYGPALDRRLIYVNVDGRRERHPHDYPDGQMRVRPDEQAWLRAIGESGAQVLLVGDDSPAMRGVPIEEKWALGHPDRFVPTLVSPAIRIYTILAARGAAHTRLRLPSRDEPISIP